MKANSRYEPFHYKLKWIFRKERINIYNFSQKYGITPVTIYSWLSGAREPSLQNLINLIDVLDLSDEEALWLVGRKDIAYPKID